MGFDLEATVRALIASGDWRGALAWLNGRSLAFRFSGLFLLEHEQVINLALFDRDDPAAARLISAPVLETYCSLVRDAGSTFITDAASDSRVPADHVHRVTLRAYCGVPLVEQDGKIFGTFCHFDPAPAALSQRGQEEMRQAARVFQDELQRVSTRPTRPSSTRSESDLVDALTATELLLKDTVRARDHALAGKALAEGMTLAREEALQVVAHDLKSPIATVTLAAQVLKEPESQSEDYRLVARRLQRAAEYMNALISDLLDAASLESGRVHIQFEACDLVEIVGAVIEDQRPLAAKKNVRLELEMAAVPKVHGESRRLYQVIDNLVSNAIKFTPEGGGITVSTATSDQRVCVTVQDEGPGLSPAEMARVFERHWQSKQHRVKGSGLGLYIAKEITKAHGGTLTVASEPERGARFTVALPARDTCA